MSLKEVVRFVERTDDSGLLKKIRSLRPYKIPTGYMQWRELSAIIALGCEGFGYDNPDLASRLHAQKSALWFIQNAPIYCISEELLQAFNNTDIVNQKELLANLQPPLFTFILLFPQGKIISSEGNSFDMIVVHLADKNYPQRSQGSAHGINVPYFPHYQEKNFHWSGTDSEENIWFSGMGLKSDGEVIFSETIAAGSLAVNKKDEIFIEKIRAIALQSMLALAYEPELFEDANQSHIKTPKSKGFGVRSSDDANKIWYPRWLGKSFDSQVRLTPQASYQGGHGSPRTHVRRGHWRRVAFGAGRTQREWRWIQPTLINA